VVNFATFSDSLIAGKDGCGGMTFWRRLEAFGDRPALIKEDGAALSYAGLAAQADTFAEEAAANLPAGMGRPLVLIETANAPEPVMAYLGALRAGWPVILVPDGATAADTRILDTYRPNLIVRRGEGGWDCEAASRSPVAMHPDLAVMLSTSGTTGAPKLVRLSAQNLAANAESIALYLGIDSEERAIATLPFHYSYGLSVLHTHLLSGAALILTDRSVVDEHFWQAFTRNRATSLALVPFQFELLESCSFEMRRLPTLRTVTQAGGRLAEPLIRRFAALGRRDGWQLFVMYGQTEASPRMAYVPPDVLAENADAIGEAVPGGRFELLGADGRPVEEPGVPGELVYHGPNVMMGYATGPADLAKPAGPPMLRTGDLAERKENGLYRIVGRMSRFVKLFGLRISLDEIEQKLRAEGHAAYATGNDRRITVHLAGKGDRTHVRERLIAAYGLTPGSIHVGRIESVPLLSSGKVDYRALAELASKAAAEPRPASAERLRDVFAAALRRDEVDPARSFAEQGGDSLAYIDVQLALIERLGAAPEGWEAMPLSALEALEPRPAPRLQAAPMDLLCRVAALLGVVTLHATSLPIAGGAHILLMLAGFSLARFQRTRLLAGEIGPALRTMLAPIMACYYAILAIVHLAVAPVDAEWFLLAGNFDADINPRGLTPYWFVCLYAQAVLLAALPFAVPAIRERVAAQPFLAGAWLALGLMVLSILLGLPSGLGGTSLRHPAMGLQLMAVGWCVHVAGSRQEKLIATALAAAVAVNFWPVGPGAVALIIAAALAVLWIPSLPLPQAAASILYRFGRHSMLVYLAHVIVIFGLARLPVASEWIVLAATLVLSFAAAEILSRVIAAARLPGVPGLGGALDSLRRVVRSPLRR
jgi:acyl-CoA synthetase (AMP-forming)/AMP-acid ligase II